MCGRKSHKTNDARTHRGRNGNINSSLHEWVGYFHYRNSLKVLSSVKTHVEERLRTHLHKRHKVRDIEMRDTRTTASSPLSERVRTLMTPFSLCITSTPVAREGYRFGVARGGFYKELLNSDSGRYWVGNTGNFGGVMADEVPSYGRQFSLNMVLPPLSMVVMKPKL